MQLTVNVPITYTLDETHPLVRTFLALSDDEQAVVMRKTFIAACQMKNVEGILNENGSWAVVTV